MPIGTSDGEVYNSRLDYLIQTAPRRGLEGSTEPADALKSSGGTNTTPGANSSVRASNSLGNAIAGVAGIGIDEAQGYLDLTSRPEDTEVGEVLHKTASPLVNITDKDIDRAVNIGMEVGPLSFMGVQSRTFNKVALEQAKKMEADGLSHDEIWKETGTFKGADGKWRQEIPDKNAKVNKIGTEARLGDLLEHPELYDAYPGLSDMKVYNDDMFPNRPKDAVNAGHYIRFGREAVKDKGVILHEIQHTIQDREFFAQGGSPGYVGKDFKLKYEDEVNKLRPELLKLNAQKVLTKQEGERLDYLRQVFQKYVEYSRKADVQARENYLSLAGEVESRNVDTRADLSPTERQKMPPQWTEDTPRSKQIVRKTPGKTTPYRDPKDGFLTY